MNYRVKCSFCPNIDLEYASHISYSLEDLEGLERIYSCKVCKTDFFYEGELLVGWNFVQQYKNDSYIVRSYKSGETWIRKNAKCILILKTRPNLTPHNFVSKIPTILVFL